MHPEGVATGRINRVFPWFSSVYSTCSVGTDYHCAPLRPPTATILHSAGCKVLLRALSPGNNCQLVSSGLLQTLPLPIVSPSTFPQRFTFCATCIYRKDERVLNGEPEDLDGSVSTVPSYRLGYTRIGI
jgi:hypothetical protein